MAQVYGRRVSDKSPRPLFSGRLFRLLFCMFLFTAAAVCKNVLPDGYRQALVTGLDSGLTFRDVLEVFGESASSQEAFSRLWSEGVLKVFGFAGEEQEVSGDISDETPADIPEESDVSASLELSEDTTIPVILRSEVSFDVGELPGAVTIPESAAPLTVSEATISDNTELPEESQVTAVVSEGYQVPEEDAGLPVPDVVSTEATAISFSYVTPVLGTLTSGFGYRDHPIDGEYKFHYGVDLAVDMRTEVACFTDGKVIFTGQGEINGNYMKVEHADGFVTLYAHLDEILVETGDSVQTGEIIALSGATGQVSGPHLHFQIYHNEKLVNPEAFLEYAA